MGDLVKFKKIGGGSMRLKDGRRIKPQEVFSAEPSDVPNMDLVEKVEKTNAIKRKGREKEETVEKAPQVYYKKKRETSSYWDVFSKDGKQVNEKALTEAKADELLSSLN